MSQKQNEVKIDPTLQQPVVDPTIKQSVDSDVDDNALLYRPIMRPPIAVVRIQYDGEVAGETFTVRTESFRFGRTSSDAVITHDDQISGEHCELLRRRINGRWKWFLKDLDSTNGTFIRVKSARLEHNTQIAIGCFRYRFDAAPQGGISNEGAQASGEEGTKGWQIPKDSDFDQLLPGLVRQTPDGDADRYVLDKAEQTLGSLGDKCDVVLTDDRMVSSIHAQIRQNDRQQWVIEDLGSLNGTWLAIDERPLDGDTQFQIGEQRVLVKFP